MRSARVIQTGELAIQVRPGAVRPALDRLVAIAAGAGGYVSGSRSDEADGTGQSPSGTTTLRVPAQQFTAVIGQVRALGKVLSASTSARDVTSDYVDLGASPSQDRWLWLLSSSALLRFWFFSGDGCTDALCRGID